MRRGQQRPVKHTPLPASAGRSAIDPTMKGGAYTDSANTTAPKVPSTAPCTIFSVELPTISIVSE